VGPVTAISDTPFLCTLHGIRGRWGRDRRFFALRAADDGAESAAGAKGAAGIPGEGAGGAPQVGQAGLSKQEAGDLRPKWLPEGTPTWVYRTHHPAVQLCMVMAMYAFHLLVLSKNSWSFPTQLIPNDKGAFQSIGLDSVAGALVLAACVAARVAAGKQAVPNLLKQADPPWRVPRDAKKTLGATSAWLLLAYIASGYGAVFCEQVGCAGWGGGADCGGMRARGGGGGEEWGVCQQEYSPRYRSSGSKSSV